MCNVETCSGLESTGLPHPVLQTNCGDSVCLYCVCLACKASTCLFWLYSGPSRCSPELLVSIVSKHDPRQGHELEVGGDLACVAQNEMHLLALPVEGLTNLCTGGLQFTPAGQF